MSCKAYLILIIKQVETEGEVELPPSLRNNVVVLDAPNASGSTTKVYVMGVSHVSKIQAEQVWMGHDSVLFSFFLSELLTPGPTPPNPTQAVENLVRAVRPEVRSGPKNYPHPDPLLVPCCR